MYLLVLFVFFKQEAAYEVRISDWSSDVCSSDLLGEAFGLQHHVVVGKIGHGVTPAGSRTRGAGCRGAADRRAPGRSGRARPPGRPSSPSAGATRSEERV